jgi:quinol monooxygenase YgiN
MIVINAIITATEDTIAAMTDAIIKMEQASQAEDGCHEYCFSVEIGNPNKMRITECWETREALAAHFATPHMAEFQAAMAANPSEGTEVRCYEASQIDFPPF